jgi:probable O-glycosylation ligase (exosortase A-associated)
MRDIVLTLFVLGSVPMMVYRPFVGLLFWMWLGFMNPHRLTWGFAFNFPFVQIVAIATLLGFFASREPKRVPGGAVVVLWVLFSIWVTVTTLLAMNPDLAWAEWARYMKIQVMTLAVLMIVTSRERILWSVIVIVVSICFYGVKGGIFTLATGGQHMVLGPRNSFISGNTEIAFAIVTTLPLLWFLRSVAVKRWQRIAIIGSFALCMIAVLGSYSRGALLAIGAMLGFLWLRTRGKLVTGALMLAVLVAGLSFMPDKWFDRMQTIESSNFDRSAQGRINAWWFAFHLANDRPVVGGGFRAFTPEAFQKYAPEPDFFKDSHSIYFEVLGEHGYVGLLLYLLMGVAALVRASRIQTLTRDRSDLQWAANLVRMCQVSMVGYAVGGAFLGLAYFDLPYVIMALIVVTGAYVERALKTEQPSVDAPPLPSPAASPLEPAPALATPGGPAR